MVVYAGFNGMANPFNPFVEVGPSNLSIMQAFLKRIDVSHEEISLSDHILLTLSSSLGAKDLYTKEHSIRVSNLSGDFISYLGFSQRDSEDMRKAGILHDIGKIFLSTSLLLKPDVLTEEETEAIKMHVVLGEEICKPLASMKGILPAIRNHHERWDGRGFPDGFAGEDIPFIARVLAIVDSFDAMVSERSYSGCKSAQGALETMKSEQYKGQWDPELLGCFIEMMRFMKDRICSSNG
jgi:putative two-component system response regulator